MLSELRRLVSRNPRLVLHEMAIHLEAAGFGRETAQIASTELPLDEPRFLRFASTTLFGLNPDELGSPMVAAGTSLGLFAAGALVPLLPWFFTSGGGAMALSIALTSVAGLAVGATVSRLSGRSQWQGAVRQLAILIAAAAVTFGIGRLLGTTVA